MATATEVLADLKSGIYSPIYFLQGEESFYIDQISDYIEKNALDEAQKGFNQVILYGKDCDVNAVLQNARRFPMMSDRQVVIVKEAQEIKDLTKEAGSSQLMAYLDNPLASTVLVFAHKNKSLDGRIALTKSMKKRAVFIESKKLYDNQIPVWVTDYLKEKGHSIDPKALILLIDSVGSNLGKLSNELNKILINFTEKIKISVDHIEEYIGISKDFNVFELQNALGIKDVKKANQIINHFAKDPRGNPIIPIITLLYSYFSKILMIHQSKDKSDSGVASLLKVNPFFAKDYVRASKKYNLTQSLNIIAFIHVSDLQSKGIKGGSIKESEILKELIFKILHI